MLLTRWHEHNKSNGNNTLNNQRIFNGEELSIYQEITMRICTIYRPVLFLMLAVAMIFSALDARAAFRPQWLQRHIDGSLKLSGVYHGVGFAEYDGTSPGFSVLRLAKDRALDELCYHLSVSIQSSFKDSFVKQGDFEEQAITSSLFVSTRKVLSGIQEKDKWTNPKKQRHWVILVIDKASADDQMKQQQFINEVVDRLEHKQDEILKGIKQIATMLNQNMKVYQDRMQHLAQLMENLDTKMGSAESQTKQSYESIRQEILRVEKNSKAYEESVQGWQQQQNQKIDELMRQNDQLKLLMIDLSARIKDDYFLALSDDDVAKKSADPDFRVEIKPDRGQGASYRDKDTIRFRLTATRDCYVKVIYLSSMGSGATQARKMNTLLFPNAWDRNNRLTADQTKIIGSMNELEIQAPFGKDVITVIASESQFSDLDQALRNADHGFFSEVTNNTNDAINLRTRGIGFSDTPAADGAVTSDTCFIMSRP